MKITEYIKPVCPHCGSRRHKIKSTHKRGCVTVRYHLCECGKKFATREY